MVGRDDDRAAHEHAPVAVERQEGERPEDVEVGLDPAARDVDQERRGEPWKIR